ncbi:GTP-binding protein HflX [Kosmotoga arenicorallina S304]|uniref:GTPase HflX n=1 Tax=Kosmotoga arenicorallina S304 TaxID=1453497 RepID=A0A176K0H6_9BACT|nr:GTP-binding protein HflX [Kosmotoga arenicorallina S304]
MPNPKHYLGTGKLKELKRLIQVYEPDVVFIRHNLTPSQRKNLIRELGIEIIDRTQLILEIFEKHAFTLEGKLEVELARLRYELPFFKGKGGELSNPGGGIGTRGPGEKRLELDRRKALQRMAFLKKELKKLQLDRQIMRKKRQKVGMPLIALVGYTNAGKSSLMNRICESGVLVEDKLFSTLDTRIRKSKLPSGREVLIIDTVGFIRELPHQLVESFRSTLEEISYADFLLVVVDASTPNEDGRLRVINETLVEIKAADVPKMLVFNKIDKCTNERIQFLEGKFPESVFVSALKDINIDELKHRLDKAINEMRERYVLRMKIGDYEEVLKIRGKLEILSEKFNGDSVEIEYITDNVTNKRLLNRLKEAGR